MPWRLSPRRQTLPRPHRSYGLMRQSQTLLMPRLFPLRIRSLQVAVSPCWVKDLPDVISAILSLRAWTHTPAAFVVHLPVSSHETTAFPED